VRPRTTLRLWLVVGTALLIAVLLAGVAVAQTTSTSFRMLRSSNAVAADCLQGAYGTVTINSLGPVESMNVRLFNLPPNREFDLFVIQVPDFPFGLSWYQGDMETDENGNAQQRFLGRFSIETFTVAPGSAPAPRVHRGPPFADAATNPDFAPVHQFHLGLWFNSAGAARAAGCTGEQLVRTPFNGEHNAGVQALSTRQFGDRNGPLRRVQ
jgi:hypothetical protein